MSVTSLSPPHLPLLLLVATACSRPPGSNSEPPSGEEKSLALSAKKEPALSAPPEIGPQESDNAADKAPGSDPPDASEQPNPPQGTDNEGPSPNTVSEGSSKLSPPLSAQLSPRSQKACEETCNGVYQKWGRAQRFGCNCRTKDHDRACRDGSDCEGACLADDGKKTVTDPGPPEKGYFLGHCSELRQNYGCHQVLPRGITKNGPYPLDREPPTLCVD